MGTFPLSLGFGCLFVFCAHLGSSSQARFTELPESVTAREGDNVEMACAFRGSGSPSYYLEIQWWFIRAPSEQEYSPETSKIQLDTLPQSEMINDETKISTVKVMGSDISHKLQISKVRKDDEGLYECRVTDANNGELHEYKAQGHLYVNASHARALQALEAPPLPLHDGKGLRAPAGPAAAPSSERPGRHFPQQPSGAHGTDRSHDQTRGHNPQAECHIHISKERLDGKIHGLDSKIDFKLPPFCTQCTVIL